QVALALLAQPLDELLARGLVFLHEAQQFLAQGLVGRLRAGRARLVGARRLPTTRRRRARRRKGRVGFIRGHDNSRPDGFATSFAGADANAILERQDEDFAVADLTGLGGAGGVD